MQGHKGARGASHLVKLSQPDISLSINASSGFNIMQAFANDHYF